VLLMGLLQPVDPFAEQSTQCAQDRRKNGSLEQMSRGTIERIEEGERCQLTCRFAENLKTPSSQALSFTHISLLLKASPDVYTIDFS
jgi:hypothetical protein